MKIPRFVKTLYFLLEKESPSSVATWATDSLSFVIVSPQLFASTLLPKYFAHSNWTKFTAELARFGFRPDHASSSMTIPVEYSHVDFQRGNLKRLHYVQPRRQGDVDRRAVVDDIEDTILQIKREVVKEVVAAQDIANYLDCVFDDSFDLPLPPRFRHALPPPSTSAPHTAVNPSTDPMYLPAPQLPRRIPACATSYPTTILPSSLAALPSIATLAPPSEPFSSWQSRPTSLDSLGVDVDETTFAILEAMMTPQVQASYSRHVSLFEQREAKSPPLSA